MKPRLRNVFSFLVDVFSSNSEFFKMSALLGCRLVFYPLKLCTLMLNASSIRCLITAGPTREYLDPVRFISNPSTGKMGFALAEAALDAGWNVDLVSGPVALEEPDGAILYPIVTANEMLNQVDALFDACDVLIMAAAVSDFRPMVQIAEKQKKEDAELIIEFEKTTDILKTMTDRKVHQVVVGFAAETHDLITSAKKKLYSKNLDWIVANNVSVVSAGFASETNEVILLGADGTSVNLGPSKKSSIAKDLIELIAPYKT